VINEKSKRNMNDIYSEAQEYALSSASPNRESRRKGYLDGYNKAREKYQFTEEDILKAYDYGSNALLGVSKDSLIQSLLQQNEEQ
jgi:hypothetical protein